MLDRADANQQTNENKAACGVKRYGKVSSCDGTVDGIGEYQSDDYSARIPDDVDQARKTPDYSVKPERCIRDRVYHEKGREVTPKKPDVRKQIKLVFKKQRDEKRDWKDRQIDKPGKKRSADKFQFVHDIICVESFRAIFRGIEREY